ncbi:MAG: HD domain-containing protein [Candidatus Woesearchaeota archaeon]
MMTELDKLRYFYRLKSVDRHNSQGSRKESSAEHTWSCLILADYFFSKIKQKLDRVKVYKMLMYHDLVEIEEGDVNILHEEKRKNKKEIELKAAELITQKIPSSLSKKYLTLFQEYEEQKTLEARFCKAIDALDAEIHEMDYKQDWKSWTEEFLRCKKEPLFVDFPEIQELFEETIKHVRKEGYFEQ